MSANSLSNSPIEGFAQPIELGWSSQRLALRDNREDWTGITNPAERRKLQNRLNQRARSEWYLDLVRRLQTLICVLYRREDSEKELTQGVCDN